MESSELNYDPKSPPAYQAGHHWVSPLNFASPVQQGYAFPDPLTLVDSTLRKILYISGLRPSIDDVLRVAEAVEEVGIREVMLNLHWWGDAEPDAFEREVCQAVFARGFAFRATVSTDRVRTVPAGSPAQYQVAAREALDTLRALGVSSIAVSLADPGEAGARERQVEWLPELFSYGQSLGISFVLGFSDVGRRDLDYVVRLANEGIRLGAIGINLTDSYSSLSPEAMKLLVTYFSARLAAPVPVTVHAHNDFGLGSATAIAAATAGAHPDVSVNGISYRSGFAVLEEVALSLELLYGVRTGIRLDYLQTLSDLVAERTGLPNPPMKPITGAHQFLRDLPMWTLPYLNGGPEGFPPAGSCVAPSAVGARMWMAWGHHPANAVIQAKLDQMGLGATREQLLEIRRRLEAGVRARESYPRWLTEDQVEEICRAVVVR